MTSVKQFEANRRNSLKSTGPKTETGKQASRCNAVRHGLTAETVIGALEDAEDYKAFEAAITADFDAQSAVERELVLRLASLLWRLRRATTIETGLFEIQADHLSDFRKTRLVSPASREIALGVLGKRGYGTAEHFGVDPHLVDIWMGTLSKALAGCGGYIAGCHELVEYLRLTVGAFVYSVGVPPVIAASTLKALEILHRDAERVGILQRNGATFRSLALERGLDTGNAAGTAICPIIVADSLPAVMLSQRLLERGINVQPVMYPAVPAKASRLRFFLTAKHTDADIAAAIRATAEELGNVRGEMRSLGDQL